MKSKPSTRSSSLSRRDMLVTSGAVVAAGMTAQTARAAGKDKSSDEIEEWRKEIFNQFTVRAAPTGNGKYSQSPRMNLKLVDIIESEPDSDRPDELRSPFSLVFEFLDTRYDFPSGIYHLRHPKYGRVELFMNEVMDMEFGDLVAEAVFG